MHDRPNAGKMFHEVLRSINIKLVNKNKVKARTFPLTQYAVYKLDIPEANILTMQSTKLKFCICYYSVFSLLNDISSMM